MTRSPRKKLSPQFREAFDAYRWDHHLASDTITWLPLEDCRDLLMHLWGSAPNSIARALAVMQPDVELAFDTAESRVQAELPVHWKRSHADAMDDAWRSIRPANPA